jgi:hypothetical protein
LKKYAEEKKLFSYFEWDSSKNWLMERKLLISF